ncbi:tetratricopeptide (TPR) repeat protein [Azospirillum fermentarium]|uniref:tetratricopeptide repeat protein n=1 Tax=Azospirillum fermentarium TaxID=1233114 RepID=UPI002227122A|nr:tetratricopeptide repeat protein [Azospirillum fermentarium]MCW2249048.1 tetratricopeptide (TPR) repeat protein [Azospirillum fermentarium]
MSAPALSFEDAVRRAAACHQQGRLEEALSLYGQLQAARPQDANLSALVGTVLAQMGRTGEALVFLEQALDMAPGNVEAAHNLAHALAADGQAEQAADTAVHLGRILYDRRDFDGALAAFGQALEWFPRSRAAAANLGATLQALGRHAESIERLTALLDGDPGEAEAHSNLGNAQLGAGDYRAAAASFRRALAINPSYGEAESNLGLALAWLGGTGEAEAAAPDQARTLETAASLVTLGNARQALDPLADIESCYRKALILQPDFPAAHWNLALCLLLRGDFERGWAEHEWRWRWPGFGEDLRPFSQPVWRRENPDAVGGPLLVTAEQGLGDTLQFIRYLPLLAERGYEVVFEAQGPLFTLLWFSLGGTGVRVVPRSVSPAHVHDGLPFAMHVPLMSLPERFGTRLDTIPAAVPYLHADPFRRRLWRDRLDAAAGGRLKVGLAWRGRPTHSRDRDRSMPPDRLAPLLAVPGMTFFSLHKDAPGGAPDDPPGVVPLGPLLHDVADTAAAMANLDLVITVDTVAAHLAGGLGVPVWTLLPFSPDWRWMLARTDSPWYPTMTLFRQPVPGDWGAVMAAVAQRLAGLDPVALTRLEGRGP